MGAEHKLEWQRQHRNEFKAIHGYSRTSHYSTGGQRQTVLQRDGYKCIECGMTDAEHKAKWGRPITIDHKDRNKKNNSPDNLRTMCLRCHGRKDITPALTFTKLSAEDRIFIMADRANGETYQSIALRYGCCQATVHKWMQIWKGENQNG